MLTLGAIAVAIMVVILLRPVRRAVAAAAAGRDPHRRRLGVRPRRLPRHPAHDRHHRRPPGDARRRHRLRDPDARPGRGGGGHRPRRPPDPGDGAQPRPGAARRHLRRHLRLRRPALRQGADDPRLRPAARRRHRRDLPRARSSCRSPPSASASSSRPRRARTSARAPSAGSSCASARCPQVSAVPLAVASIVDLRRRHRRRGQARRSRPTRSSGSTRTRRRSRTSARSSEEIGSSSELGVFVARPTTSSPTRPSRSSTTSPSEQLAELRPEDGQLLTASSIESRRRRPASTCPGATDIAPTGDDVRGRLRGGARRTSRRRLVSRGRHGRQPHLPHRAGLARGAGRRSSTRSADDASSRRRASRATPSGLAVVGVGLLDNLEANRILLTYLAIAVRVPVPRRAAARRHPVAAVAGAGAHRGRRGVAGGLRAST